MHLVPIRFWSALLLVTIVASSDEEPQPQPQPQRQPLFERANPEDKQNQLRELCRYPRGGDSDYETDYPLYLVPGFVSQLNYGPLDRPPDGAIDWMSWIASHAQTIVDWDDCVFFVPNDKYSEETPDAFGMSSTQYFFKTVEQVMYALDVCDLGTIYLGYMQRLHDSTIHDSMKQLGSLLNRTIDTADFYISRPNAGSFGWHFDYDDGLVYLVQGTKRFRVAGQEVGSEIVIDVVLQPGDALFIPAGYYYYDVGGSGNGADAYEDESSIVWNLSLGRETSENWVLERDAQLVRDLALLKNMTWDEVTEYRRLQQRESMLKRATKPTGILASNDALWGAI